MADKLLTWKGKLPKRLGRLTLIKTILTACPIYTLINVKVSAWVRKAMEKIMKAFLWMSSDTIHGGKCLVAWPKV
jgi:hypothetical protein